MRSPRGAAWAALIVVGLAACASDGGDADSTSPSGSVDDTAIEVTSTPFATAATTSTTSPPTTSAPLQPGDVIPTESTYTIQSGDYPSTVAAKFKVALEELLAINELELDGQMVPGWPQPGTEIKIPAGATVPNADGSSATTTTASAGDGTEGTGGTGGETGTATTTATATTIDICAESTYTIQEGDTQSGVAAKFDTTLDALAAANADNPYYENFIVGFDITIPAKTDC